MANKKLITTRTFNLFVRLPIHILEEWRNATQENGTPLAVFQQKLAKHLVRTNPAYPFRQFSVTLLGVVSHGPCAPPSGLFDINVVGDLIRVGDAAITGAVLREDMVVIGCQIRRASGIDVLAEGTTASCASLAESRILRLDSVGD